ncbi:hypothetical protein B0H21DRAFT_718000 [Amylocystis lapponica]|nr:hypothetical protein B0H21DRAFT_718000 [Amylocystis lapponica]
MAYRRNSPQYPPQQYPDNGVSSDFNPYNEQQPHQTYEQAGYGYENAGAGYGGYRDDPVPPTKERERSTFDGDDIPARPTGPKTSRNLRRWRTDHQGDLWTRGSRGRCIGRFFCCTIMIFVFLVISILLSLALWIKPPNVIISQPTFNTSGSPFQASADGFTVNLDVAVSINNPNYFSVDFSEITASLFYPPNNTAIGGGSANNIDFKSNKETNFTLPLALQYNITADPNHAVLLSLADKCGIIPGTSASSITIDYKLKLGIKVLFIPIKPVISSSFTFPCPITGSDIADLLKAAGLNLGSLGGLLSGLSALL